MYESLGLYGRSGVRSVDVRTGSALSQAKMPWRMFGEGLEIVGNKLIQLTWKENKLFEYKLPSLQLIREVDVKIGRCALRPNSAAPLPPSLLSRSLFPRAAPSQGGVGFGVRWQPALHHRQHRRRADAPAPSTPCALSPVRHLPLTACLPLPASRHTPRAADALPCRPPDLHCDQAAENCRQAAGQQGAQLHPRAPTRCLPDAERRDEEAWYGGVISSTLPGRHCLIPIA